MKFKLQAYDPMSPLCHKARANNFKFEIIATYLDRWYVLIDDLKTGVSYNSLWGIPACSLDNAQKFCEDIAAFYKIKRLQDVKCDDRIKEFLEQEGRG